MHRFAALLLILGLAIGVRPAHAAGGGLLPGGVAGEQGFAQFPLWGALLQKARKTGDDRPLPLRTGPVPARTPGDVGALLPNSCEAACARRRWIAFLYGIRRKPKLLQLEAVNRWANAKPYVEDWMNWGVADYWETPAEFMRHGGDCEDYAIAKYFSLVRLGFPPADLRIVVVEDRNLKASHAVVAVRLEGRTWLLDIAVSQIVPVEIARQYRPVYAFNAQGWWLYPAVFAAASQ